MTEHGESLSGFGCADAPGNERTLTLEARVPDWARQ
jgi:hypothetical protein